MQAGDDWLLCSEHSGMAIASAVTGQGISKVIFFTPGQIKLNDDNQDVCQQNKPKARNGHRCSLRNNVGVVVQLWHTA